MIKIFETLEKYNAYTNNGQNLESGNLYFVKEDNSTHYYTNNIDGVSTIYDTVETPSGNIEITANSESLDIAEYATASVNVPIPEGYIIPSGNKEITQNGTGIDVAQYATASVAVPQPSGNITLTENGENINIAQYATATVNVASSPTELIDLIEGDITSINIPNGTTKIKNNCFQGSTLLTSVTIPNSVTEIGSNAFANCTSLPVENYIRYADTCAVEATDKTQTSYTLKEGTRYIGYRAFYNCTNLTDLVIPDTVVNIGEGFIEGCRSLTSVTYGKGVVLTKPIMTDYNFRGDIIVHSKNMIEEDHTSSTSLNYLIRYFSSCVIGDEITKIGDYVFQNSTLLTSVTIPNTVTTIGNSAFNGCTGLTSITIPNSVTSIGSNAFNGCSGLTSVTIPNSVTSIGINAFSGCSGLTSITISDSVTTIGQGAFNGCTGLTSVAIGNGVTSIGNEVFKSCTGLTSVAIGNGVTSIGNYAFRNCSNMTSFTINATTPPTLSSSAFLSTNANFVIYVPSESVDTYKAASGWSTYASRIQAIPT